MISIMFLNSGAKRIMNIKIQSTSNIEVLHVVRSELTLIVNRTIGNHFEIWAKDEVITVVQLLLQ